MAYTFNEAQEKWLQALESGKYPQGYGRLRDDNGGYCCLGVAVMELAEASESGKGLRGGGLDLYGEVQEALKLRSEYGALGDSEEIAISLASLNDGDPERTAMTHQEIAAFIRANPERVFTDG